LDQNQYRYSYLILALGFLGIWLLLYAWRRDTRRRMRILSAFMAILGPIADTIYVQDWWCPLTFTNTRIGVEPALAGFAIGGISSALYRGVCGRSAVRFVRDARTHLRAGLELVCLISSMIVLLFGSFYLLDINSLASTLIAAVVPLGVMYMKRPDLVPMSLISGGLLVIVAAIVYAFVEVMTPGWVQALWSFQNVPAIIIVSLPLDDIVFYFLTGAVIGPLYEYGKGIAFMSGAKATYFLSGSIPGPSGSSRIESTLPPGAN
jgi:hypothetical protein